MSFSRSERLALCDLLDELGPDAPTLCEGWTTHDLAAHLWVREADPLAAPGIVIEPLAGLTEKRMTQAKTKLAYRELVARVRRGPARISVFALPGLDEAANAAEYFVHHEDVRRAQPGSPQPRELGEEAEALCAKRLASMGRVMFRRCPVGAIAERTDGPSESLVLKPGEPVVELHGKPSELLLFAFGRGAHADVELRGDEDAVQRLRDASFGI
ncbi:MULTISPECIES: TIGR03085 family metal-binding protein [unclassified Luteococcus]|uniref:TIGR03085 family metal-binding protein n=1 Tax=unclassified Luteococcus TaxID=2639923 RepID=UPI00313C74B3